MRIVARALAGVLVLAPVCVARAQVLGDEPLGFEGRKVGGNVPGWFVPTAGFKAEVTDKQPAEGARCAMLFRSGPDQEAPFGNMMQMIGAGPYRGLRVALKAKVRVEAGDGEQPRGQMWLRVDRSGGETGAFDNMDDRPIRPGDWIEAVIEADIAEDAQNLALGFMSMGGATVFIDSISLTIDGEAREAQPPSPPRALSERGLENVVAASRLFSYVRFFDASDQAVGVRAWDHVAVAAIDAAEPAGDAEDLARRLAEAFGPIAPMLQVWPGAPEDAPPMPAIPEGTTEVVFWKHVGAGNIDAVGPTGTYSSSVERRGLEGPPTPASHAAMFVVKPLGGGVCCRLMLQTYRNAEGTLPRGTTPEPWAMPGRNPALTARNRSTRLAGVAVAWGVMQHFYPYFDVVETDWDAALTDALAKAARDADEIEYFRTLREMIARLHDGHGGVYKDSMMSGPYFPLALAWAGPDLVVAGLGDSVAPEIAIGDILVSIDGRSAEACGQEVSHRISAATEGWRRANSARCIAWDLPTNDPANVVLRHPEGDEYAVQLARTAAPPENALTKKRPADGSEPAPGVVYFNLAGAPSSALAAVMDKLKAADGIIFDMRGYPAEAAYEVIQHLIDQTANSARWNVPVITRPDREGWDWRTDGRWNMPPLEPRLRQPIVFMTYGGAISYAESIMGIVEHYRLGEIVGSTTAGTNGNVNPFQLPGGFLVAWTGMKVLKHDGSQHHGVGIPPTVAVEPTAKGIAEGRDEVLEKAVEVIVGKIEATKE